MRRFVSLLAATTAIFATGEANSRYNAMAAQIDETSGDGFTATCAALLDRVNTKHQRRLEAVISEYEGKLAEVRTELGEQIDKFESFKRACGPCGDAPDTEWREAPMHGFAAREVEHKRSTGTGRERLHHREGEGNSTTGRSERRALLQESSEETGCSKQQVMSVINAVDRTAAVLGIMPTNPSCGICMAMAANSQPPDSAYKVFTCLHQRENECGASDLAAILPSFSSSTLQDRPLLIKMLESVSADCAYCVLETVEFVCGPGCVKERLHLHTDYPVLHRAEPCVPALATHLASAQATAVRAALQASAPFGLSAAPVLGVSDLYFAEGRFGGWAVYRGTSNRQQWLYRCLQEPETWVVTSESDQEAWTHCSGRFWIELAAARLRSNPSDDSIVNGLHFDLSPIHECSAMATRDTNSVPDEAEVFAERQNIVWGDLSASDVACTLLLQFGSHIVRTERRSITVRLPSANTSLLGDVIVRAGDTLVLEAEVESALLSVGRRQIRVESGGSLDLVRINIVDSVESSAVFSEGTLRLLNCTFERCVANTNVVSRIAEGLVTSATLAPGLGPTATAAIPAFLGAWGGAVLAFWTAASVVSSGSTFANNAVRGASVINAGGAICAFGASVTLEAGTTFQSNRAQGGARSRGGALSLIYAQLDVSNTSFLRNRVERDSSWPSETDQKPVDSGSGKASTQGTPCHIGAGHYKNLAHALGGALHLGNSKAVVTSTKFEENGAQDGNLRSLGGAIFINDGSSLRAEGCSFTRNRVTAIGNLGAGGAIRVDVGATVWLQNTLHEANVVESESEANGGAISSAGHVILAAGNVFRANSVSGMGRSTGGAIAVGGQGSMLVALDGAHFVDNKVKHLSHAAKLPLRLRTCLCHHMGPVPVMHPRVGGCVRFGLDRSVELLRLQPCTPQRVLQVFPD